MKRNNLFRSVLAITLIALLGVPSLAIGKSGKKFFKEGVKLEAAEKWDQAAEQFALALNQEPGNPEYKVHYLGAVSRASQMYMARGRQFEESRDWQSAYQAYYQAFSYDPGNEMAKARMKQMLDKQGVPNDNGRPITREEQDKKDIETYHAIDYVTGVKLQKISNRPKAVPPPTYFVFDKGMNMQQAIKSMGDSLHLNVLFDDQFRDKALERKFEIHDVTPARAMELFLNINKLFYAQADIRTIVVAMDNPANRQRYMEQFIKTFYLRYADLAQVKEVLGTLVGTKQATAVKNLNALVVKDTAPNLQLIENVIASIDKPQAEVMIDINMYEVSHNDMLQIGNQFATDGGNGPGLSSGFGGLFHPVTSSTTTDSTGASTTVTSALFAGLQGALVGGPLGLGLAVPASTFTFLQGRGRSKLVATAQVRAFENEETETKIGQSVPIQTASIPNYGGIGTTSTTSSTGVGGTPTGTNGGGVAGAVGGAVNGLLGNTGIYNPYGVNQIQYRDVGLVIKMKPIFVTNGGDVKMKMHIESTGVQSSSVNALTPTFTQRSMDGMAQTKDGQSTMIAGVTQNTVSESRSGVPVLGLLPVVGNFFVTPKNTNDLTHIIVTVTPHVLRAPTHDATDTQALADGSDLTHPEAKVSLQEIVDRADDYEYHERQVALERNAAAANGTTVAVDATAPGPIVPVGQNPSTTQSGTSVRTVYQNNNPGSNPPPAPPAGNSIPVTSAPIVNPRQNQTAPTATPNNNTGGGGSGQVEESGGETAIQNQNSPITVLVRSNVSNAPKGQTIVVALLLNGAATLSKAHVTLNYNSSVLTLTGVRDGGLFRLGGINPELTTSGDGGQVVTDIVRPPDTSPVPANGQLFIYIFNVTGEGDCDITVDPGSTEFLTGDNQVTQMTIVPAKVTGHQ